MEYKRTKTRRELRPAYVYTHENPRNNPHVNCLFYVPKDVIEEFKKKLVRWVTEIQGVPAAEALFLKTIKPKSVRWIIHYIIKGVDPEHIDRFGLRSLFDRKDPQGIIFGQRAGFSRSLGPRAQKKSGFEPMKYYRAQKTNWKKHRDDESEE